ncbi:hypothetical protein GUITHDRAFT_101154 [Guillardia theta CCMP2712]|uniref:Uncharacterized protein n=1 Tax=Guillardia theta (strain CCMP2712) TaxID=905079 RepID=L1JZC4_GUITC|nr:hypothetical protein GUITHDRAFT_101154 [Guillardia theta CCMP2712]EKX53453.1 hypothetical protein GUITHDRAFT_101154 [Guillardia theta CCMP2712]|eukprot:XP_005840433.1 hypothetical protein GUITHDRAFT_101154 [Guillardia theta CCMP2712]
MEWRHKGEMQREKSTNEALASFASSLTRKMAELQTNLKLAEHKSSTLLSELEGQKSANSKLNQEAHELREILEKKNKYIDKLDCEIEDARGEARRLAEVVNTLQAENTTLKKKIGSSLRDYKTRTEELVKANLELESMTEACECSWTEVKVLRRKLENLVVLSRKGEVKDLSSLSDVELCEMIMVEMRSSQDRERQLEGLLEHSRTLKDVLQHELNMAKESLAEFQGELRVQSEIGQEKLENEVRTQSLIRDLSSKLKEAREELLKERSEKEDVLRKHHVLLSELSYAETDFARSLSPRPYDIFSQCVKHPVDDKSKTWQPASPNSDCCNKHVELNSGWRVQPSENLSSKDVQGWAFQKQEVAREREKSPTTANEKFTMWQKNDLGRQLRDIRMRLTSAQI